jgi:diguanylate cyclase (GGDEF)-like protein
MGATSGVIYHRSDSPMRTERLIDQLADLASQRNQDALDRCFMALFEDLLSPRSVVIYRWMDHDRMPCWQVHRRPDDQQPVSAPLSTVVLPHGDEHLAHRDSWTSGAIRQRLGAHMLTLVPMGCHDETHCLVEIASDIAPSLADERMIRGVQRFYSHLRALLDENERDALTRLLNRKSFDETFLRMALHLDVSESVERLVLAPEDERRNGHGAPPRCWLGVIDIDHFKRVNDQHGHLIGDEVLILVGHLMRSTFRHADRLYRFGGEEFVVLLRAKDARDAGVAFERFRAAVEAHSFPQVGRLTVSIGFTEVLGTDTPSTAFQRADEAVYYAKHQGRNLVADHDALVDVGTIPAVSTRSEVEFF